MGLLDSALIRNIPAIAGPTTATTPSFTSGQTITLTNPGGYRSVIIKFTITGGNWGYPGTRIYYPGSGKTPLITKLNGDRLSQIEDGDFVIIDAACGDLTLYATANDSIAGKTISYTYLWINYEPLSFDERKLRLLCVSERTLASTDTTITFAKPNGSTSIDVSDYKYFFVAVFCKLNNTAQNLTCTIRRGLVFQAFDGVTRTKTEDLFLLQNESIGVSKWDEVRSPEISVSAKFASGDAVDGAKFICLVYGVR